MRVVLIAMACLFSLKSMALHDPGKTANISVASILSKLTVKIMLIKGETMASCTASFISKRALVTAAHCLPKKESDDTKLMIMFFKGSTPHSTIVFEAGTYLFEAHPNYDEKDKTLKRNAFDLGVISLPFQFDIRNHKVVKVLSPKNTLLNKALRKARLFRVLGAGSRIRFLGIGNRKDAIRGPLKAAAAKFVNASRNLLEVKMLNRTKACKGDSGGPVFVKNTSGYHLVGVNSAIELSGNLLASKKCAKTLFIATIDSEKLSWIKEAITRMEKN